MTWVVSQSQDDWDISNPNVTGVIPFPRWLGYSQFPDDRGIPNPKMTGVFPIPRRLGYSQSQDDRSIPNPKMTGVFPIPRWLGYSQSQDDKGIPNPKLTGLIRIPRRHSKWFVSGKCKNIIIDYCTYVQCTYFCNPFIVQFLKILCQNLSDKMFCALILHF